MLCSVPHFSSPALAPSATLFPALPFLPPIHFPATSPFHTLSLAFVNQRLIHASLTPYGDDSHLYRERKDIERKEKKKNR